MILRPQEAAKSKIIKVNQAMQIARQEAQRAEQANAELLKLKEKCDRLVFL